MARLRPEHWRRWLLCAAAACLCLLVLRLWPHPPLRDAAPLSRMVLAEQGELLRLTLAEDEQFRLWVDLDQVSPAMVDALLLKEDRAFYWHPGVNPLALLRAVRETYAGGARQGGSTLSMQLARRIHQVDSRRIPGKLRQIVLAFWLEARYSKRDILEAYLNLAPMGGNIEGVETASRIYFGKTAAQLSLSEALTLAVIPQRPGERGRFGDDLQQARLLLLSQWRARYPDDVRNTLPLNLPVQAASRKDMPFHAPHFSEHLLASREGKVLQSTLSLPLQALMERQIQRFVRERQGGGVRNAVAVLVDTRTQAVKAWVGSADYFSQSIDGQVNGVRAQRSPGSTLKPFLYGLALDQGLLHPQSVLRDAPTVFGNFRPENHDHNFVGPITAQQALVRSRNVPAVWIAQQLRAPSTLYGLLRQAGVRNLRHEAHYGLALALGAGEVSPEELAGLYLMLSGDGVFRPLRYLQHDAPQEGRQLLSPQAAFIVRDMLRQNPRHDGLPPDGRGQNWPIAWKTGTSWAYRDAWSAGIVGPYVLVVWVGNFDGRGNAAFVGQETAAPLFFRIADALRIARPQDAGAADAVPPGVRRIQVCRASGDLPNRWCPETRDTWFIPGVSPIRVSSLHRPVRVDKISGQAVCPPYDPEGTREEIHAFWPTDMLALFRQAGLPRRAPPVPPAACGPAMMATSGAPPRIQSPSPDVVYSLRLSESDGAITLSAAADSDTARLYWFAGNTFVGAVDARHTLQWRPERAGTYELRVSDDRGRAAWQRARVEFVP